MKANVIPKAALFAMLVCQQAEAVERKPISNDKIEENTAPTFLDEIINMIRLYTTDLTSANQPDTENIPLPQE